MIIKTKELKKICSTISSVVEISELNKVTSSLEIKSDNNVTKLNISNGEYYISILLSNVFEDSFHVVVNAQTFLKLISQLTTEDITLVNRSNYLEVKANGNYKLPLIFDDDKLTEIKKIWINNETSSMVIDRSILTSIMNVNSKELLKTKFIADPVQQLYYIDQQGCITFTSGACINNFTLEKPIKLLLNNRIIKLFKLFNDDKIKLSIGYDPISDSIIQTKMKLEDNTVSLTVITPSTDDQLAKVPVKISRDLASASYNNIIFVSVKEFLQAIDRLLIFADKSALQTTLGTFEFNNGRLLIESNGNTETVNIVNDNIIDDYETKLNLFDIKVLLEACEFDNIRIGFGNHKAIVLSRGSIDNIVMEFE